MKYEICGFTISKPAAENFEIEHIVSKCFENCTFIFFQDIDAEDLSVFKDAILKCCDRNTDGKIDKEELTLFLMKYANTSTSD